MTESVSPKGMGLNGPATTVRFRKASFYNDHFQCNSMTLLIRSFTYILPVTLPRPLKVNASERVVKLLTLGSFLEETTSLCHK